MKKVRCTTPDATPFGRISRSEAMKQVVLQKERAKSFKHETAALRAAMANFFFALSERISA